MSQAVLEYCRQPFIYLQGPVSQTYLPYVCPFHLRDNQWDLIPCPNKLIPQLTCKSKVQGHMKIPGRQTVPNLAVNQLNTHRVTQFVMETWSDTHTHNPGSLSHTLKAWMKNLQQVKCLYSIYLSAILHFAFLFVLMYVFICVCVYMAVGFFSFPASHSLSLADLQPSMCSDMVCLCGLFLWERSLVKYGQNASRSMGSAPASFPPCRALSESAKQSPQAWCWQHRRKQTVLSSP